LIGQIFGRWGNFFNREAFGGYTDNIFAMQIKLDEVGGVISDSLANNIKIVDGIEYIQVHPTFLYESLWNLVLLIFILLYKKHKKCQGDIACIYMIGYGIGRAAIETLRTDQLMLPVVNQPVSILVSVIMIILGISIMLYQHISLNLSEKSHDS
jgi:phosphatidylglycerol:prolipoprotein diacylglycerol transferase